MGFVGAFSPVEQNIDSFVGSGSRKEVLGKGKSDESKSISNWKKNSLKMPKLNLIQRCSALIHENGPLTQFAPRFAYPSMDFYGYLPLPVIELNAKCQNLRNTQLITVNNY